MACYLIYTWLVVQSDPVNVAESWGRGGGCGHCGNDVMEECRGVGTGGGGGPWPPQSYRWGGGGRRILRPPQCYPFSLV